MSFIWFGGEDLDFPNGTTITVSTNAAYFRTGYSRCAIQPSSSGIIKSETFTPVTSCWFSCRICPPSSGSNYNAICGLGKSGTNSGLFIGMTSTIGKLGLYKRDAGTNTLIASEVGLSLSTGALHRVDMHVVSYGASATVNVFLDGVLLITFTGAVNASGVTDLDQVWDIFEGSYSPWISEVLVADEDTRPYQGIVTHALTGAGTTDSWTGVYSTINQTAISDATPNYSNTSNQDQGFNITDMPAGVFSIAAFRAVMRAAKSASPTPAQIAMGFNSGGSVAVGSDQAITTSYATYAQIFTVNPVTGVAFTLAEMNALQLYARSKA